MADHPLWIRTGVTAFSEGGGIGRNGKGNGFCLQNEFPPIDCVSGDKLTQTYYTTP